MPGWPLVSGCCHPKFPNKAMGFVHKQGIQKLLCETFLQLGLILHSLGNCHCQHLKGKGKSPASSATSMDACRFIWWKMHAVNMQNELISRAWGTTQVNLFSEVAHHSKHKKLFTLGSDIILAEMALPLPQGSTILCCNQMCKGCIVAQNGAY